MSAILKIRDADGNIIPIPSIQGDPGKDGEDGFSPIVELGRWKGANGKAGVDIRITDVNGTKVSTLFDGETPDHVASADTAGTATTLDNEGTVFGRKIAYNTSAIRMTPSVRTEVPVGDSVHGFLVFEFEHNRTTPVKVGGSVMLGAERILHTKMYMVNGAYTNKVQIWWEPAEGFSDLDSVTLMQIYEEL